MKVAFFIGSLNRGGTEMLTLDIFRRKDAAPFEMMLVYRNEGTLSDDYRATGVPMFRLKPKGSRVKYLKEIRSLLKQERVDILHAQTLTNGLFSIACTAFSPVKMVFTFHGLFSNKSLITRHLVSWNADADIFVSQYVRDWYRSHSLFFPERRSHTVHNGIDFSKIEAEYPEPEFFKEYESRKTVRLGMVGNFVGGRSQIVVCKALKLLKDRGADFHFYFIGKKSDAEPKIYDACVNYCRDNGLWDCTHFIGSRGDVPAILQYLDGFVFSTIKDTFGIAVIEAIAAGLPTITNDWAVMKEISLEGTLVDLFESGNEKDCCDKMQSLIDNLESRKEKASNDAAIVKDTFSIDRHIASLNKVYEKTLL
jgi:glycosyltransferase involved in cell wall biosynthesis